MTTKERIQELVLAWKTEETTAGFERIRDALILYINESPITRIKHLTEDEEQELLIRLFVDRQSEEGKKPCQLKRSLHSYITGTIGQTGTPVFFLTYFKQMILNRIRDICRKRDNYTARNPNRRPKNETPQILCSEPEKMEANADSAALDEDILREVLNKEIRTLFFEAVDRVSNDNYRQPYLFSFFFAEHLPRNELAALFNIAPGNINTCMQRATKQVSQHFKELLREQDNISSDDLYHMLTRLNSTVITVFLKDSTADLKTMAVIRSRFMDKVPPQQILINHDINAERLHEIEKMVVHAFFKTLDKVRTFRSTLPGIPESGGDSMEFYEEFMHYLSGPPLTDRTRAETPLGKDEFECHEIFKLAMPTGRQKEQLQVKRAVGELSAADISEVTRATALSPAEISAAINDPEAYSTQYRILVAHLKSRLPA